MMKWQGMHNHGWSHFCLYYFCPNLFALCPVPRYHYFLQLKMDVIERRMSCEARQAIQLAAFSMQGKQV